MGCMRSSKLEDGLSFHLRMIVQPTTAAATDAATAMRTVKVVRVIWDVDDALEASAAFEAEGDEVVTYLITEEVEPPTIGEAGVVSGKTGVVPGVN